MQRDTVNINTKNICAVFQLSMPDRIHGWDSAHFLTMELLLPNDKLFNAAIEAIRLKGKSNYTYNTCKQAQRNGFVYVVVDKSGLTFYVNRDQIIHDLYVDAITKPYFFFIEDFLSHIFQAEIANKKMIK